MRRLIVVVLLLSLVVLCSSRARAQPPADKPNFAANAAVQYWQAFAAMPTLEKDQQKMLEECLKAPLDATAVKLVESSRMSVQYLRRGAKLRRCDWGLDYNDGLGLLLPHLAKARDLARLAALHARLEFHRGHPDEGVEDVAAIFVLARHVSDPIMIALLVSYNIDGIAVEALAPELPRLGESLHTLAAHLEKLPATATLSQVILNEKMHMDGWMIQKLREVEAVKPGLWRGLWKSFFEGTEDSADSQRAKAVDTYEKAIQLLEDLRPVYDEWAKVVALPKREFDTQYPELLKQARAANPLAGLLLPPSDKVVAAQARSQAQMALLKAAVAVVQGGPDKLKDIKDPFANGPFEYRPLAKGFELKSKLLFHDQPVTLTVGQTKQE